MHVNVIKSQPLKQPFTLYDHCRACSSEPYGSSRVMVPCESAVGRMSGKNQNGGKGLLGAVDAGRR